MKKMMGRGPGKTIPNMTRNVDRRVKGKRK
jgi:hypothetical protein